MGTSRYRGYGGGGGRYGGGYTMSLSFPPFTPAVKWLIIANIAVFFLVRVVGIALPEIGGFVRAVFALVPALGAHGYGWQLFTYAFLNAGIGHIRIDMLLLCVLGAQLELGWGRRQFLEFYFFCVIGAALGAVAVSF